MPTPKTKTVTFNLTHNTDTKGAERYEEVTEDDSKGHLRTMYFRKELFTELGIKATDYDVEATVVFKKKS